MRFTVNLNLGRRQVQRQILTKTVVAGEKGAIQLIDLNPRSLKLAHFPEHPFVALGKQLWAVGMFSGFNEWQSCPNPMAIFWEEWWIAAQIYPRCPNLLYAKMAGSFLILPPCFPWLIGSVQDNLRNSTQSLRPKHGLPKNNIRILHLCDTRLLAWLPMSFESLVDSMTDCLKTFGYKY